jgi:polyhydroxyalkanoate synthesis repressor PhaR
MTRQHIDYKVLEAKTGKDITHQILTQIIMDEETHGVHMLPVNFLRDLICLYGNSMQSLVPHYLEASMDNFCKNQAVLAKTFGDSLSNNPMAKLAEKNIAMFKAAASALIPGSQPSDGDSCRDGDLAALREQMAEMQQRLDALGK